jgi:hypothetical protein
MIILYGGHGYVFPSEDIVWARGVWRAKFLTFSRTIEMPRSSEAFSSSTRFLKLSGLKKNYCELFTHKGADGLRTQTTGGQEQEWSTSCQFLEAHRIACGVAMCPISIYPRQVSHSYI